MYLIIQIGVYKNRYGKHFGLKHVQKSTRLPQSELLRCHVRQRQRRRFQRRGYIFLTLPVKRENLLAHDWPTGCLATAYANEKLLLSSTGIGLKITTKLEDLDFTDDIALIS